MAQDAETCRQECSRGLRWGTVQCWAGPPEGGRREGGLPDSAQEATSGRSAAVDVGWPAGLVHSYNHGSFYCDTATL